MVFSRAGVFVQLIKTVETKRCSFQDLPEDMQTLVFEIVEAAAGESGLERLEVHEFNVRSLPVSAFPSIPMSTDYRDEEYGEAMIEKGLPPLVIHGNKWLDGRHRLWALKRANVVSVDCIDLQEIFAEYPYQPLGFLTAA